MNENLEASSHANCTNPVWVPGLLTCMSDLQTSRFSLHSVSLLAKFHRLQSSNFTLLLHYAPTHRCKIDRQSQS
jgi:hypothetical protein